MHLHGQIGANKGQIGKREERVRGYDEARLRCCTIASSPKKGVLPAIPALTGCLDDGANPLVEHSVDPPAHLPSLDTHTRLSY